MPLHSQIRKISRLPEARTSIGQGARRSYRLVVEVILKDGYLRTIDPAFFTTDDRLPGFGTQYPAPPWPQTNDAGQLIGSPSIFDDQAYMYDYNIVQSDNIMKFQVEYLYSTSPPDGRPIGTLPEELRRVPQASQGEFPNITQGFSWTWEPEEVVRIYTRDGSGDAKCYSSGVLPNGAVSKIVHNTAGDRYETQPTIEITVRNLTVKRLEKRWRPTYWERWGKVKNKTPWQGQFGGAVLSLPVSVGEWQEIGKRPWYPVTYRFKWPELATVPTGIRPLIDPTQFWDDVLSSYGYQQKSAEDDNKLVRIKTKDNRDITTPWPLDAAGRAIFPPGSAPAAETRYLKLRFEDFADLNITLPDDETEEP